eukprot:m.234434 g.234434  ORF g.234434 m.234434 type:complete len:2256 (+) comp40110_c0_seq18:209-6976(+)
MAKSIVPLPGEYVWYDSGARGEYDIAIGAQVRSVTNDSIVFRTEEGNDVSLPLVDVAVRLKTMHQNSIEGTDDMIHLHDVHEAGIVRNLRVRFARDQIYTYTGTILVAMNPNKRMDIYGRENIEKYHGMGVKLAERPPHIYAIANAAHIVMLKTLTNQCIITSGESGAGKTESTKLILQFLAAQSGQHSWIEQQILDANPILEAFGNAKTVRNYNSSRFGKYIEIHFDQSGYVQGAKIEQYLLEKSRVVSQNENELNYHVFYCMLAGMEESELDALKLSPYVEEYNYLTQGGCPPLANMHTKEEWIRICGAMKVLMFSDKEMVNIFKLLAAILHIGNLRFRELEISGLDGSEIVSDETCAVAANLMEVDEEGLRQWFTFKSTSAKKDTSISPLSVSKAEDVRNAFAKGIYARLFTWVNEKINRSIFRPEKFRSKGIDKMCLGVLDIFGFENSDLGNYFEQLCVNYTNEKLHQFFLRHIFSLEQSEYEAEKINWSRIPFVDNQVVLDLLAMKPMNLLAIVDEESRFPKGNDQSFLDKFVKNHGKHSHVVKSKPGRMTFEIVHFAGPVTYNATGFLEKNRDTFSKDLIRLLNLSKSTFLQGLFEGDIQALTYKTPPTLATQFKQSLNQLMKILGSCKPFFVRCIKPNILQKPMLFERKLCLQQLRYSGMMETVRIRIAGYPVRLPFEDFVDRYRLLLPNISLLLKSGSSPGGPDYRAIAEMMGRVLLADKDWQAGRTKMFIKESENVMLEKARALIIETSAVKIQRAVRFWIFRRYLARIRVAIISIQRAWRTVTARRNFLKMRAGFIKLQAAVRRRRQRRKYLSVRRKVIAVQARCRGFLLRVHCQKKQRGAILMQCLVRRWLARRRFAERLKEAGIETKKMLVEQRLKREQEERETVQAAQRELERLAEIAREEEEERLREEKEQEELERLRREAEERERLEKERREEEERRRQEMEVRRLKEAQEEREEREKTDRENRKELELEEFRRMQGEEMESQMRMMENRFSTVLGEEKAFGFETPTKVPVKMIDSAVQSTPFVPLPGAIEASFNLSPIEEPEPVSPLQDEHETEEEEEEETKVVTEKVVVKYKFSKFMTAYFQRSSSWGGYSRRPFKESLLYYKDPVLSSTAVFLYKCIMQFMGDWQEGRGRRPDDVETGAIFGEIRHNQLKNRTMPLPMYRLTKLEKLHYIVGHGILYPNLRDEIFCIIYKQIYGNPNQSSKALGWILLCLCLCCFFPSKRLLPYLRRFIKLGPKGYSPFCEEKLKRTMENGSRHWPPSFIELQAAKAGELCRIPVSLMDGHVKSVLIDSATTAEELCHLLAEKTHLSSSFGFAIYISVYGKVYNLGSDEYRIMDAVSPCEQFGFLYGDDASNGDLQDCPWRLLFCKEVFTPWNDEVTDPIATDLIYEQIMRGLKSGEYTCENAQELGTILAQQYYVQHGKGLTTKRLHANLDSLLPKKALNQMTVKKWASLIKSRHSKGAFIQKQSLPLDVKRDVVNFARSRWPIKFSRLYAAQEVTDNRRGQSDGVLRVAINSEGFFVFRDDWSPVLECPYADIVRVSRPSTATTAAARRDRKGVSGRRNQANKHVFVVVSLRHGEKQFASPNVDGICRLVSEFLDGLRRRSRHVVALRDAVEGENIMGAKRGDLIVLARPFERAEEGHEGQLWLEGTCSRTRETGVFPADSVYAFASLEPPDSRAISRLASLSPDEVERLFFDEPDVKSKEAFATVARPHKGKARRPITVVTIHTLEEFASQNFALGSKKEAAENKKHPLWSHSKNPIKRPLLKSLVKKDGRSTESGLLSLKMFLSILKYCGEYPSRQSTEVTELTDELFATAISEGELKDELYCQILKQLTNNTIKHSERKAWELLWLITGLFSCSPDLAKEVNAFLHSYAQRSSLARECQQRLSACVKFGISRKYPPHIVEVYAVQTSNRRCYHKVSFPDGSERTYPVSSRTKVSDLSRAIATDLGITKGECFDLLMEFNGEAHAIQDQFFFFDYIRQFIETIIKQAPGEMTTSYKIIYLKKLWLTTKIGTEPLVDHMFHFPQELPKYLQGYHKSSITQCPKLGALLYRINFGRNRTLFSAFETVLAQLVPSNFVGQMKIADWRKLIEEEWEKLPKGLSKEKAQSQFLEMLSDLKTFGSALFPVKQSVDRRIPNTVIVAVNAKGIHLLSPDTKDVLYSSSYREVMNWSSGPDYFHLSTGDITRGGSGLRFLCETTLGPKMENLISSYVAYANKTSKKQSVAQRKKDISNTSWF